MPRPHWTTGEVPTEGGTRRANGPRVSRALDGKGGRLAMSTRHHKTLARIHQRPTPADIRWQELVSALKSCGVEVTEREGSRVGLKMGEERIVVHRPHPGPTTGRARVRDIAAFLNAAGVTPARGRNDG